MDYSIPNDLSFLPDASVQEVRKMLDVTPSATLDTVTPGLRDRTLRLIRKAQRQDASMNLFSSTASWKVLGGLHYALKTPSFLDNAFPSPGLSQTLRAARIALPLI